MRFKFNSGDIVKDKYETFKEVVWLESEGQFALQLVAMKNPVESFFKWIVLNNWIDKCIDWSEWQLVY